jgi:peptidoglycan-N-acetylglucosamine deacetylase
MSSLKTAYASEAEQGVKMGAETPVAMEPMAWFKPASPLLQAEGVSGPGLTGRTLTVASAADIKLHDKEVVLTFDDGPAVGKTEKVLDILDKYNVKASFMMVGQMARNHPEIAQEVLARGNSIGSHTFSHKDLATMNFDAALAEITKGDTAVSKAVAEPVGAFRFPYLASTSRLRRALAGRGIVVMDVNIDSKDYFTNSPDMVFHRTMASVRQQKKGIILMHDIHNRTIAMLPKLLEGLKTEGYHVVNLHFKRSRMPETNLVASAH